MTTTLSKKNPERFGDNPPHLRGGVIKVIQFALALVIVPVVLAIVLPLILFVKVLEWGLER